MLSSEHPNVLLLCVALVLVHENKNNLCIVLLLTRFFVNVFNVIEQYEFLCFMFCFYVFLHPYRYTPNTEVEFLVAYTKRCWHTAHL
jgi:hypothetical protein